MAGRKSDFTLPTLDDLFSTQDEREEAKLAKIREIPLTEIDDFPDHPYKVRDDEDMQALVESGVEAVVDVSGLSAGEYTLPITVDAELYPGLTLEFEPANVEVHLDAASDME